MNKAAVSIMLHMMILDANRTWEGEKKSHRHGYRIGFIGLGTGRTHFCHCNPNQQSPVEFSIHMLCHAILFKEKHVHYGVTLIMSLTVKVHWSTCGVKHLPVTSGSELWRTGGYEANKTVETTSCYVGSVLCQYCMLELVRAQGMFNFLILMPACWIPSGSGHIH